VALPEEDPGGRKSNSGGTESGGRETTLNSSGAFLFKPSVSRTSVPPQAAVSNNVAKAKPRGNKLTNLRTDRIVDS
jgi:hypothetical protein